MARVDGVFVGKVAKFVAWDSEMEATVIVEEAMKGGAHGEVRVRTGKGDGDCGFSFEEGKSYLFYALKDGSEIWRTNVCTRTRSLEGAGDEILELEGRLPTPNVPSRKPIFELKGRINDSGYDGYVFVLRNRLHDRIFYFNYLSPLHLVRVRRRGHWKLYPSNFSLAPRRELSPADVAKELARQKKFFRDLNPKSAMGYVDRLHSLNVFVARPTSTRVWRAGFQYVTEAELDRGVTVQKSKRYVWSEPFHEKSRVKTISFNEAFGL